FVDSSVEISADGHEMIFDDAEKGIEGFRGLLLCEAKDIGKTYCPFAKISVDISNRCHPFHDACGKFPANLVHVVEFFMEAVDQYGLCVGLGRGCAEGLDLCYLFLSGSGEDVADDFGPAAALVDITGGLLHLFAGLT